MQISKKKVKYTSVSFKKNTVCAPQLEIMRNFAPFYKLYNKMKLMKSLLMMAFCAMTSLAVAQQMPPVPNDPSIRIGKLDNGLTYYIRHNNLPENQAEFYIAQRVGSILEEEDQRGLAHFLEHMCFNGTKNFPGNELIRYLESVGVKFGQNLNAYTSMDRTVYNISNVPTARLGVQDSCLLILHDWSHNLLLDGAEIDKERGVIHEEWRSRQNAMGRMQDRFFADLFPGLNYGTRMPIGLMSVVDNFPHQALRNYYEKWYRPDLQGIVVVGDVDVDYIENKIKELFADVPAPVNPAERTYEAVPDNENTIISIQSDKEQTQNIILMMMKSDTTPRDQKGNVMYLVGKYVESVVEYMLNARFEELSEKPDAPFAGAGVDCGSYLSNISKDALTFQAVAKPGKDQEALKALYREAMRARKFGFAASEYDRARQEYLSQLEQRYTNREKMTNHQFVNACVENFLDNEPMPSVEWEYTMMSQILPNLPVDVVNQVITQSVPENDKNLVVLMLMQEKEGETIPTQADVQASIDAVRTENIEAYVDNVKNEPLMTEMPKAGKVVKETTDATFDTKEWTLSNGVRVITKKTDFQDDEVMMYAFRKGGTSHLPTEKMGEMLLLDNAIAVTGAGNFRQTELTKAMTGIQASANIWIDGTHEGVQGSSVPKDLEKMFQLAYIKITKPLKDQEAYDAQIARTRITLQNRDANPLNAFIDTLRNELNCGHPRTRQLTEADLDKVKYDDLLAIMKQRFADVSNYTFIIIGNFDEAELKQYCEQYIASLPTNKKQADAYGPYKENIKMYKGTVTNTFSKKMESPQVYKAVIQQGDCAYNLRNQINVSFVSQIVTMIYIEKIREEAGATYSVGMQGQLAWDDQNPRYLFQTVLPLKPEQEQFVHEQLTTTLQNIGKNGIEAKYFDKVKEYMQKTYNQNQRENSYWVNNISTYLMTGVDMRTDYLKTLDATTPEMIQKFINEEILKQNNVLEVTMLPQE